MAGAGRPAAAARASGSPECRAPPAGGAALGARLRAPLRKLSVLLPPPPGSPCRASPGRLLKGLGEGRPPPPPAPRGGGVGGSRRGGGGKPSRGARCWGDSAVGAGPGAPEPSSGFAPARRSAAKKSVWGAAGALRTDQVKLCRHKACSRRGLLRMIAVNCHEYSAYVCAFSV
ncbi:unnamed protein product [Rangifer tarandus platyrhynchus]|uniref:Uncharacterized protein n=2 Tax=Rangifer tarandus platyrhynchus TaxID=3082113 RepID=A0ACB0FKT5_RANTA|nr:unnamed protein product [Rangifer tarandus platyrhynchus]CAI9713502.1 unnamed protein product [Rangifer tarandus platyrhynchus]